MTGIQRLGKQQEVQRQRRKSSPSSSPPSRLFYYRYRHYHYVFFIKMHLIMCHSCICSCVAPSIIFYYHPCHHISLVDCHSCIYAARSEKTKKSCVKKYLLTCFASDDISLYTNNNMFQNHPKLNPKQIYGNVYYKLCTSLLIFSTY